MKKNYRHQYTLCPVCCQNPVDFPAGQLDVLNETEFHWMFKDIEEGVPQLGHLPAKMDMDENYSIPGW